jgi:signal transduction histidine kinase
MLTPGYVVVYPNRETATSKATKATVAFILLVSVALILIITIGGWSKLQGLKAVNFAWCIAYLLIAFYVMARWTRGLLPIAAALAILLLILALIAGTGISGTSWFDREHAGFASPQTLFGGAGLSPDMLGLLTLILVPVQALLILFAMRGFAQAWNVEVEVPEEEARRRGYTSAGRPPTPAAA